MLTAVITTLLLIMVIRLAWPESRRDDQTARFPSLSPGEVVPAEVTRPLGQVTRWAKTRTAFRRARTTWRALRAAARFANRHRVALTPVFAALAALAAGAAVYGCGVPVWAAAAVAAAVVWAAVRRTSRAGELAVWLVAYPAAAYAVWVTACALWPPHLPALGAGAAVHAVMWWAHPAVRRIVAWQAWLQYQIAWWPRAMRHIGKPGVKVKGVTKIDAAGRETVWRLQCPPGVLVEDLHQGRGVIESAMRWPGGVIRKVAQASPRDRSLADLYRRDVETSRVLPVTDLPAEGLPRSIYDAFLVGGAEAGDTVTVRLATRDGGGRHVLLAGTTQEGKSTQLGDYAIQLAHCEDVVLVGLDRKGCIEIRNAAHRLARIAQDAEQGTLLLESVAAMIDQSGPLVAAGQRVMRATRDNPALVVLVDELARWTSADERNQRARRAIETIVTSGRAAMVILIAATNSPSSASIGKTEIRTAFDVIHLYQGSPAVWRNMIGSQVRHVDFAELTGRGRHYLLDGRAAHPRLLRGFNNTASRVLQVAVETGPNAPVLHELREKAGGRAWATAPGRVPDELLPYLSETQRTEVFRVRAETPAAEPGPAQGQADGGVDPSIIAAASTTAKAAAMAQAVARACLMIVAAGAGGFSPNDLVGESGMARATVNRWLKALTGEGLVRQQGYGRYQAHPEATADDLATAILGGR
ncbi:hypothetical protein GCM10017673_37980 [Streptosporangium violaceochromogenes]|nr:hypothetical protein GCM10017673_37980 [Streptosporangium violaceochromogenes]